MSTSLSDDGQRILARLEYANGEMAQFGVHTGKREEAQHENLALALDSLLEKLVDGNGASQLKNMLRPWIASYIYVQEYGNFTFNYDGWYTITSWQGGTWSNTGAHLPPQLSVAVTYETSDEELPPRRRKNRFFLPPMNADILDDQGMLSKQNADFLGQFVQTLHASLEGIPVKSSTPAEAAGLCTVTYKGTRVVPSVPQLAAASRIRVGRIIDTQRRRRNMLDEDYQVLPLA